MSTGYSNWKNATLSFKRHKSSACHREAVEMVITLPATTSDIAEQLSLQHSKQKEANRQIFMKILSSLRFLVRQGLPLRGSGDDRDGNFYQLLQLIGDGDSRMDDWMKRKSDTYTSHFVQNEIVKIMATNILRDISTKLQQSPFLTLMMDETTDISNNEQTTIVLRWVSEDLIVNEEFIGLYQVPSIDAATLVSVARDTFQRLNLSFSKLRGQCYDGASSMSGAKSGVAKRISEEEPRAVYTHCYGHSINLAACDAIKQCKPIKCALEVTHEICKLIKYSPRREGIFRELKNANDLSADCSSMGIRVLCPTRWTVRANALASIICNYTVLQSTWEEAADVVRDTESKARINGVAAQMKRFEFLFGTLLGEMLLQHCDNLSQARLYQLQKASIWGKWLLIHFWE